MNLVAYSMKTKGADAFTRRLWTVFTRFGVSEGHTRRSLQSMIDALQPYHSAPTFFIPATVLARSPSLIRRIQRAGAEVGIHGYVHNDYRALARAEQANQTREAISVFKRANVGFQGFRNPYLGWNDESLEVFRELGFVYDSNEAVIHDVIAVKELAPALADSFARSLTLFQAIPCTEYNLRPHVEDGLLRIPTSIPDDEMLFDRLRITEPARLGGLWSEVMRRVYDCGGIYVLNLHPERGELARGALDALLRFASERPNPVWITPLREVAAWWRERAATSLHITPAGEGRWQVEAHGSPRATLLARNVTVEGAQTAPWPGGDLRALSHSIHHRRNGLARCDALAADSSGCGDDAARAGLSDTPRAPRRGSRRGAVWRLRGSPARAGAEPRRTPAGRERARARDRARRCATGAHRTVARWAPRGALDHGRY